MPGKPTKDGIEFPANASGKSYIAMFAHRHRGQNRHKSTWRDEITPDMEYESFCTADTQAWFCQAGHYWCVRDIASAPFGTLGERLAKFPRNQNKLVPWHGFPLFSESDAPSDALVERWIADSVIPKAVGRRIQRGQL